VRLAVAAVEPLRTVHRHHGGPVRAGRDFGFVAVPPFEALFRNETEIASAIAESMAQLHVIADAIVEKTGAISDTTESSAVESPEADESDLEFDPKSVHGPN